MPVNQHEPLPTRASLLSRLQDPRDDSSWEEFHRMYRGLLVGMARRAGLNEHEAEEAVQETLIAVARKMPEFRYEPAKDSFKGWLLQIVRWKILDQVRKRSDLIPAQDGGPLDGVTKTEGGGSDVPRGDGNAVETSHRQPSFESIWDAEWERHILALGLAAVKRQARPEHYAIYHLHVIEERSVAEVARILGCSAGAVYLAKLRVGALLRRAIKRIQADQQ